MTQPDLGGQLAQVIASLRSAAPEVLAMAERSIRMDAALTGGLYLVVMIVSIVLAIRAYRWVRSQRDLDQFDMMPGLNLVAYVATFALTGIAVVMLCQLPGQLNQLFNARYYAVCDMLRQARP
jgi:uncharacterized membrane protein YidH (DUF202 family)